VTSSIWLDEFAPNFVVSLALTSALWFWFVVVSLGFCVVAAVVEAWRDEREERDVTDWRDEL
jgi:protein-S-isoprenylcysteine O-methyltransferase Ste14